MKNETSPLQQSLFDPSEPMRRFDGATYEAAKDADRLTGQLGHVFDLMRDGKWRDVSAIKNRCSIVASKCYSEAAISARLRDLRKENFGSHTVEHRRVAGGLWEYRLLVRK